MYITYIIILISNTGVYLRELTLCSDGNAIFLDDSKEIINFERMKLVASRILELDSIDASPYFYELQPIKGLNSFLMNVNTFYYSIIHSLIFIF